MGIQDTNYEWRGDLNGNGYLDNGANVINVCHRNHIVSQLFLKLSSDSSGPDVSVSVEGVGFDCIAKEDHGLQGWFYYFQAVDGPRVTAEGTFTISVSGADIGTIDWQDWGPYYWLPQPITMNEQGVTETAATLRADIDTEIDGRETYTCGFKWGTTPDGPYPNNVVWGNRDDSGLISKEITGLSPNTDYYYVAYLIYELGTKYGYEQYLHTSGTSAFGLPQII